MVIFVSLTSVSSQITTDDHPAFLFKISVNLLNLVPYYNLKLVLSFCLKRKDGPYGFLK